MDLCLWTLLEFYLTYHFQCPEMLTKYLLSMFLNFILSKYPFIVLKQSAGDLSPGILIGKQHLQQEKDSSVAYKETNKLYLLSIHSEALSF